MRCPGQDQRRWRPEDMTYLPCPDCGREVELFPDETKVRCSACGRAVSRERPKDCLDWCAAAEACAGWTEQGV